MKKRHFVGVLFGALAVLGLAVIAGPRLRHHASSSRIAALNPPSGSAPSASMGSKMPVQRRRVAIRCDRPATPINPLIYGIASGVYSSGESAHRIGGNPLSRLNWDLGDTWNAGSDWFFENVKGSSTLSDWIDDTASHGAKMAITVPIIGWVAKDSTSVGFPVTRFGPQRRHDPGRPEAGDGYRPDGTPLTPSPETLTSISAPPATIRRWIESVRQNARWRSSRAIAMYILDNEPGLWNATHRDVHPQPLTYDELLDRTIEYGTAIRQADPAAVIAGPAEWGWSGYFFSAKDIAYGSALRPDRRAHGDVPLLPWYLRQLAEHEKKTGVRILDLVDVHFYPQAPGVYGAGARTDAEGAALRLRATRALWDPEYRDESWIGERVDLIPRLKNWIAENYPGRGISIGEWSFGAEEHISGGLAIAEALGRFGQQGLTSAFYWRSLAEGTPGYWAFRAFRNFDGAGNKFLDWSVPTDDARDLSIFASRNEEGNRIVAVLLNLDPAIAADIAIEMRECGRIVSQHAYDYGPGSSGLAEVGTSSDSGSTKDFGPLFPYSLRVISMAVAGAPAHR